MNNSRANSNANSKAYSNSDSHATGGTVHSNIENNAKNTNSNTGTNTLDSSNHNSVKNSNKQEQSQSTENSNNAQQNLTVQGDSTVYKAPDIPVSSAIAPPSFPTSPCRIALSAGLSLMNVRISGGGSTLDTQCDLRASAQAFSAIGDNESAEYLLCSLDASKKLPKCQSKLEILNANAPKEITQQSQISSIIK